MLQYKIQSILLRTKKTEDEIIENKIGICEYFTILYIPLLNSINIKEIHIHDYSVDSNNIFSNPFIDTLMLSLGTWKYINNEWIELDAI